MLGIADSSALIALATCQALEVAVEVFGDIKVPQAVYNEVVRPAKFQAPILSEFQEGRVVQVDASQFVLAAGGLGRGEIESMAPYKQISADILLIDDRRAKTIAEYNQIHTIGSLGMLLLAKHQDIIERVAPIVERLRNSPIYFGETLLVKVLQLAKE
jgi:predicted nucleic acid-binding protein